MGLRILNVTLLVVFAVKSILPAPIFHELSKIPYLYNHYCLHKQIERELTVTRFIAEHYGNELHVAQHSHQQLPFKSDHSEQNCGYCVKPVFAFRWIELTVEKPALPDGTTFILPHSEEDTYLHQSVTDIFQPPKHSSLRFFDFLA